MVSRAACYGVLLLTLAAASEIGKANTIAVGDAEMASSDLGAAAKANRVLHERDERDTKSTRCAGLQARVEGDAASPLGGPKPAIRLPALVGNIDVVPGARNGPNRFDKRAQSEYLYMRECDKM